MFLRDKDVSHDIVEQVGERVADILRRLSFSVIFSKLRSLRARMTPSFLSLTFLMTPNMPLPMSSGKTSYWSSHSLAVIGSFIPHLDRRIVGRR